MPEDPDVASEGDDDEGHAVPGDLTEIHEAIEWIDATRQATDEDDQ